jgi:L-lactate permease
VVYRIASWIPIVVVFAAFAADRQDAPDAVMTTLIVIGFIAVLINAVVFFRTRARDT